MYKNLEFFKPSNMHYRLYIYIYYVSSTCCTHSFIWSLLVFTEVDWNTANKCVWDLCGWQTCIVDVNRNNSFI